MARIAQGVPGLRPGRRSGPPAALAPLLLASASPRRAEILSEAGWEFRVRPVDIDESPRRHEAPEVYCQRVAAEKARAGAALLRQGGEAAGVVLGGDTIVVLDDEILGKPRDARDARAMLQRLAGRTHRVLSAVSLLAPARGAERHGLAESRVRFAPLDDRALEEYLASGEWEGKAGAYAIQGAAAGFAHLVSGDLDTVVGLPLALVQRLADELCEAH